MSRPLYYVCLLKKFNNYFNRIIKGFSTLSEYKTASDDFYLYEQAINWNPADNVSTELVMNDCPFEADYLLILDAESNIVSRWFIMETVFTRQGQYKHELRRDVIYDHLTNLMNAPVYVEKGWLQDSDPFIFNPEGMSFNQIKTDEKLLKDKTNSAWIVGYIAKNAGGSDISITKDTTLSEDYITVATIAANVGMSENELMNIFANGGYFCSTYGFWYGWSTNDLVPAVAKAAIQFDSKGNYYNYIAGLVSSYDHTLYKIKAGIISTSNKEFDARDALIVGFNNNKSAVLAALPSIFNRPYYNYDQYSRLLSYNGQKVLYNGQVCLLEIRDIGEISTKIGPSIYSSFSGFSQAINDGKNSSAFQDAATFHDDGVITIEGLFKRVACSLSVYPYEEEALETKISASRKKIDNNIFDMFVIPYNKCRLRDLSHNTFYTVENVAQEIASEIARELDAECYDVQLLPYFPIPELEGYELDLTNFTIDEDYNYITRDIKPMSGTVTITGTQMRKGTVIQPPYKLYVFDWQAFLGTAINLSGATISVAYNNCGPFEPETTGQLQGYVGAIGSILTDDDPSTFSVTITYSIPALTAIQSVIIWAQRNSFSTTLAANARIYASGESLKIVSECEKYRICSPNYQGAFDLNLAKNGGEVRQFFAECTYKPFTPYIKVVPEFDLLYGANYGDARGLICGGDFSLPRVKDAWESFELNNKNYQNIFNREIQNLDTNQEIEYRRALITGGIGIATGGLVGSVGGLAATGSPWGAVAGGALGSIGSAIGMKYDIDFLQRQQREAKQYAIDKYNYQLGNIKALPYTITTVGNFTINSKIWPFLEHYTCTEQEKDALKNKIKYESMTVMRIDPFGNYYRIDNELHYFKGQLIRNEEIAEDNHILEAIYAEIAKGVYM